MTQPSRDLAGDLKDQALALADARAVTQDALTELRSRSRQQLQADPFPDQKNERWKYTSLRALEAGHLQAPAGTGEPRVTLTDFGFTRLVFVNGQLRDDLSQIPEQAGLEVIRFNGSQSAPVTDAPASPFAWLNGAAVDDGLLLRVANKTRVEQPIHVLHISDGDEPASCHQRLRLELGEQSEAVFVEQYSGTGPVLTNAVTEIEAGAASSVTHYRLQNEGEDCLHINSLIINQARDSQVRSHQFMTGTTLRRNEVQAQLNEPGAELNLQGAFLARGHTHTDNQLCIEHRAPHCTSHHVYKGVAGDTARLVFNGRMHIHPGAKGTSADLSNQNLLLSKGAEIDTKPELEIYNDDVVCSHGTTVGQLDELQLFYLQSRGIERDKAQRMLGIGFINEQLLALPHEPIADWARTWLADEVAETQ